MSASGHSDRVTGLRLKAWIKLISCYMTYMYVIMRGVVVHVARRHVHVIDLHEKTLCCNIGLVLLVGCRNVLYIV